LCRWFRPHRWDAFQRKTEPSRMQCMFLDIMSGRLSGPDTRTRLHETHRPGTGCQRIRGCTHKSRRTPKGRRSSRGCKYRPRWPRCIHVAATPFQRQPSRAPGRSRCRCCLCKKNYIGIKNELQLQPTRPICAHQGLTTSNRCDRPLFHF